MIVTRNRQKVEVEVIEVTPTDVLDEKVFGKQRNLICELNGKRLVFIINDDDEVVFEPRID